MSIQQLLLKGYGGASVTGGTITTNGSYTVHTFTSSGSLIVAGTDLPAVEYLVVAGGGSGGAENSGGGGGGGVLSSVPGRPGGGPTGAVDPTVPMTAGTYAITVGAGGNIMATNPPPSAMQGVDGDASTLAYNGGTITATGGGGGGYMSATHVGPGPGADDGRPGGSGGGGGAPWPSPTGGGDGGTGISNQGYAGYQGRPGPNASVGNLPGGGGGGAAEAGKTNPEGAPYSSSGGDGILNDIDGNSYYYGGGGGGRGYTNKGGNGGKGGGGGGNACAYPAPPTGAPAGGGEARNAGQDGGFNNPTSVTGLNPYGSGRNAGQGGTNTGGGGGGCWTPTPAPPQPSGIYYSPNAGRGGPGIVIIRYTSI